jgi:hypothetical protein
MEPLFEAKAHFDERLATYNVYRVEPQKYKAQLVAEDDEYDNNLLPPAELLLVKRDGRWETEGDQFIELVSTLGLEIDAFNNGYGAILGRIGNA